MINKALQIAWEAHKNQYRKGTNVPYIIHPVEVAVILIENGADSELIAAGFLHDTLEDTKLTIEEITSQFGEKVSSLVVSASEPEKLEVTNTLTEENKINTWKERKQHTIGYLKNFASLDERLLACADKLSNIRSMAKEYKVIGEALWEKFNNKNKVDHKWYYRSLIESLTSIEGYSMYRELRDVFNELFTENT